MGGATWLGPVELDLESLRSFIAVSAEGRDNAVIRTVADLELRRGTWVAWDRKAADDPALMAALGQLREEYSAADGDNTMRAAGADASLAADGQATPAFAAAVGPGRASWRPDGPAGRGPVTATRRGP